MGFTAEQRRLYKSYYDKALALTDHAKIVQLTDLMLKLLLDASEADIVLIKCKRVVVNDANRGGSIMQIRKVFQKGSKILGVGFSLGKCDPSRAVCFQINPKNKRLQKWLKLTNANKHFATFDKNQIEASSVGCCHLNQLLACIVDEVEVPTEFVNNEDLFGKAGGTKLDRHDISKRDDKDLPDVLEHGLRWTRINYNIEEEFPKSPHIFQKALNVEHHIGEGFCV